MVRIIDEGPDPSVVKQIICKGCGAKLEYVPNDIQTKMYSDYSGCSDSYSWIDCPKCKKQVIIH